MPKPRHPFDIALLTISLAIGIPLVLLMFGALRTRQLQSKANPRWAQFAKTSTPQSTLFSESTESRSVIRTASILTGSGTAHDPPHRPSIDSNLTGLISDHSSIDVRDHSNEAKSDTSEPHVPADDDEPDVAPIIFRAVDDDDSIKTAHATERFESLLEEIRQRLDQIALSQREHHEDDVIRESRFLEAMTRLMESAVAEAAKMKGFPAPEAARTHDGLARGAQSTDVSLDDPAPPRPAAKQATPVESSSEPIESANPEAERASEFDEPIRPKMEPAKIRRLEDQSSFEPSDVDASVVKPSPVKRKKPSVPAELDREQGHSPADQVPNSPGDNHEEAPVHRHPVSLPTNPSSVTPYDPPPAPESIHIERSQGLDGTDLFTMDIRDADIREFFHRFSEATRISILPSPEVQGRITLNLHEVRLETAFKAIIKSRGYVCEREDDIVLVSTREESAQLKKQNRTLVMKIYQPVHLDAAELNRLIEPLLSPDGRHSVTSSGQIQQVSQQLGSVHESPAPRDAVVVQDVAEVHGQIEQILVDLDVAPLQVEIEARILSVRLSGRFQHGVDLCRLPCQPEAMDAFGARGLKLGRISCQVPSFIRALEQVADAKVVTSQRIQVLNKHKAEMLIGDRIADPSQPAGSAVEAGTRLVFCPSISIDGSIRMEIHPERSTVSTLKRTSAVRQMTAELTTHVLVRDGATVAVGGLVVEQPVNRPSRVSLMHAIPTMGSSLRHCREGTQRTELIILVTPRVISDFDSSDFGPTVQQASMSTAATFRERECGVNRHQMAKAHYNRALGYYQQGNYVKARQQIDVSLCGNRSDVDAVQLRNQITTCLSQRAAR